MSNTGYKPSASELQYHRFWAKELIEKGLFDGHATTSQVDWNRLARDAGLDTADRDSGRQVAAMTLTEIVEQLRSCGYTCEAGALENNVAFRELEQAAALWDKVNSALKKLRALGEAEIAKEADQLQQATREALADYAHEAWSGWMNYLLSKSAVNDDGTWTIPADSAERWYRQMTTPYHLLSDAEKESDRTEADKMLEIFYGIPMPEEATHDDA